MTTTDPRIDDDEYIEHQIFSILSSLLCLLAPFPQTTPRHFPKEGGEIIISEQPQSSFGRAGQLQWLRLCRKVAPSTRGLLLFSWGTGILSHFMLQWKISTSRGFYIMLLHKLLDLPFCSSFVLLHSPAVHPPVTGFQFGKTPKRTHTGAPPGKRGAQGCDRLLSLSLPLPGAGGRPTTPLHSSCTAVAPSAHAFS